MKKLLVNRSQFIKFVASVLILLLFVLSGCSIVGLGELGKTVVNEDKTKEDSDYSDLEITLLVYNNAYYERVDKNYLKREGLPTEFTNEDLLEKVGIVEEVEADYAMEKQLVGADFYKEKTVNSDAFYIVDTDEGYEPFVYCNKIRQYKDELVDASANLEIYNIIVASDIDSLAINDEVVTDKDEISEFLEIYKTLKESKEYDDALNKLMSEEDWQNGDMKYLVGSYDIEVKLKSGLSFSLGYYPVLGHIQDKISDYMLTDEERDFFDRYVE